MATQLDPLTVGATLSVSEITSDGAFQELREEWNRLLRSDDRATIFQTWEFQYHAWRMFAESVAPRVLLVRDATGQLLGAAPIGEWEWSLGPVKVRILGFLARKFCDYGSFIVHPAFAQDVLATLAGWVSANRHRWDLIEFRSVRHDSWLRDKAFFSTGRDLPYHEQPTTVAPYLALNAAWPDYTGALSKKRARSLRYEVKNLFRHFDGNYQKISAGGHLERAITQFMDLHQARMRQNNQKGHFADLETRTGFARLVEALADSGLVELHRLANERTAIASQVMFKFRNVAYYCLGGFDPRYKQYSPGKVLVAHTIGDALASAAQEYDFLEGNEPYKSMWTSTSRPLYTIAWTSGSWRTGLYRLSGQARKRLAESDIVRSLYLKFKSPPVPTEQSA